MKATRFHHIIGLGLLAALAATTVVHATTVGLSSDPADAAWDRSDPSTAFALWDFFPATSFAGDAPDSSFGFTAPLLDQNTTVNSPGGLFGGGDRIYFHSDASDWEVTATTAFAVKGLILQVKQRQAATLESAYAPLLNGLAADHVSTTSFVEGANTNSVTSWYWGASLAAPSITSLTLTFAEDSGSFISIDAIAVDAGPVAVVPEPSVAVLLGGAGLLGLLRRRRAG